MKTIKFILCHFQFVAESCYVFSDNTHFSGCAGMVNLHFNYPLFYSKTDKNKFANIIYLVDYKKRKIDDNGVK